MVPKLGIHEGELYCPNCGGFNLHHGRVEVFERSEDEKSGIHVVVDGKEVVVDTSMSGNPSRRRHGLSISFECEVCGDLPGALTVVQHKGSTYIEFE